MTGIVTGNRKSLIGMGRAACLYRRQGIKGPEPQMRHFVGAACGLWVAVALPAQAEPLVVVELFTSQGCASCPPADEFLKVLAQDSRVIPLSLHVDYWDYIGWADSFADPAFTHRQKAYAKAAGEKMIYTPQMIVGGVERVVGSEPEELGLHLVNHLSAPSRVTLVVERQGDMLVIRAEADPPLTSPVGIQLVRYLPEETVEIERGENAGKVITYHNIVTSWSNIGEWPGVAPLELSAPVTGSEPVVVIVQEQGPAAILAAARVD